MEKLTVHSHPCYLPEDYSIDLLKHNAHIPTPECVDTMISSGFTPLIDKLTRVTSSNVTPTMIDNIFTNQFKVDKLYWYSHNWYLRSLSNISHTTSEWATPWMSSTDYFHSDVIMNTMASQITSVSIVYWIVCSGTDHRKHHSSASLAFVRGIHRSPHKGSVTRKMFHLMTSSWD